LLMEELSYHPLRGPAGNSPSPRIAVSLRNTGLGDRLICLCAAWLFARNTGRELVVDWRRSIYSTDDRNLFERCFDQNGQIGDVRLLAAGIRLPPPRHPQPWNIETVARAPWLVCPDAFSEYRDGMIEMIRSGTDHPAATVLFNACVAEGLVTFADAHACLSDLRFAGRIVEAADTFQAELLGHAPWIGLHVRHGNGGNIMGHAHSWTDPATAIDRCRRAITFARCILGKSAKVLLCTDSILVETAIRTIVAGLVTVPKQFADAGGGELHLGGRGAAGLDTALTEMLLLSRSQILVRYPAASFFTFYPAVMKPSNAAPVARIEDLQRPYQPQDALSPAVLL
jgi:Nodulation protein Z (NodZ)